MPPTITIRMSEGPVFKTVNFAKVMEVLGVLLIKEATGNLDDFGLVLAHPKTTTSPMVLHIVDGNGTCLFEGRGENEEECAYSLLTEIGKQFIMTKRQPLEPNPPSIGGTAGNHLRLVH